MFRFIAVLKSPGCSCCKPKEIANYTLSGNGTWDLTEYQENKIGQPGQFWRLRNNYMGYVPLQQGCVNKNGKLVGLPESISSDSYKYTWRFYLEVGCPTGDGKKILWPNKEKTDIFECPEENT